MPVAERVSALIITYNQLGFVEETLSSVMAQVYPDLEIVVADDGSTDGTRERIAEYARRDPRIVPVLADINTGPAGNFNRGLLYCTGEFVAYLGGDDVMLPGKIQRQVQYMRAHPECAMCYHDMEVFQSESNERLYLMSERYPMRDGGVELELFSSWFFQPVAKTLPSSHMVRASALPAHGFDSRLSTWNDWLHGIEVLRRGTRGHIPEVLGRYRRHGAQISRLNSDDPRHFEEALMAMAIVDGRYPDLAAKVKNHRDWMLFQACLYRWDAAEHQRGREAQFRLHAGWLRWAYMRMCRAVLDRRVVLSVTKPLRRLLKRALPGV